MKEIEEKAPFTSETDDFVSERKEVLHDQGPVFPYTKGLWLMCLLVGAINPYDLDALDESRPLSRFTMSQLLGRDLTPQEYRRYFDAFPHRAKFELQYYNLCNGNAHSYDILGPTRRPSLLSRVASSFKWT
jgi:hypothetical protein